MHRYLPTKTVLTAPMLCLGGLIAGSAFADEAPPPPPGPPSTIVTERVVILDKDGKPVERAPAALDGRRVIMVQRDGDPVGGAADGPEVRRRVLIMRNGEGPEGPMIPELGPDGPRMAGLRAPDDMMRMVRDLDLTPEQRTKARGLMDASRPKMDELDSQIRAQRSKLRDADPGAKGYDALVASSAKRIGELTAQGEQQRAQLRRQVWELLTPDQRAKAETKRSEAKKRRDEQADRMERRARELRGTP